MSENDPLYRYLGKSPILVMIPYINLHIDRGFTSQRCLIRIQGQAVAEATWWQAGRADHRTLGQELTDLLLCLGDMCRIFLYVSNMFLYCFYMFLHVSILFYSVLNVLYVSIVIYVFVFKNGGFFMRIAG